LLGEHNLPVSWKYPLLSQPESPFELSQRQSLKPNHFCRLVL
jgi:hypothetical protein